MNNFLDFELGVRLKAFSDLEIDGENPRMSPRRASRTVVQNAKQACNSELVA
jgi:hypothetical protein